MSAKVLVYRQADRRRGIASALYDLIEADIGRPLIPSWIGSNPAPSAVMAPLSPYTVRRSFIGGLTKGDYAYHPPMPMIASLDCGGRLVDHLAVAQQ